MALAAALKKLFTSTVTIAPLSSLDKFAKPTFGTAVSYSAKIERASERIVTNSGDEEVAGYKIFLATTTIPGVDAEITLPENYTPRTPKILEVRPVSDHHGINHIVVMTGVR